MGIAFVLLFWLVMAGFAAALAIFVLGRAVHVVAPRDSVERKRAERLGLLLPIFCVLYVAIVFVAYAVISDQVFHRDPGLGDWSYTPLPNGDQLGAIDLPDRGYVATSAGETVQAGITRLQIEQDWIAGAYTNPGEFSDVAAKEGERFFLLNARTNAELRMGTEAELVQALASHGGALKLRPFRAVFDEFRWTWFDHATGAVALAGPLCAGIVFILQLRRLRRRSDAALV